MIEFECPSCERRQNVEDNRAGTDFRCECGALLEIPSLEDFDVVNAGPQADETFGTPIDGGDNPTIALDRGEPGRTLQVDKQGGYEAPVGGTIAVGDEGGTIQLGGGQDGSTIQVDKQGGYGAPAGGTIQLGAGPVAEGGTIQLGAGAAEGGTIQLGKDGGALDDGTIKVSGARPGKAVCARHEGRTAEGTCERCGNFMCVICSQRGDQAACPSCRERAGAESAFPFSRDNWSFGEVWSYSWQAFQREWGALLACALIVIFGQFAINVVGELVRGVVMVGSAFSTATLAIGIPVTILITFVQMAATFALVAGNARVLIDVAEGRSGDVERMFSQFKKIGTLLLFTVLFFLINLLPLGLFGGAFGVFAALGSKMGGNQEMLAVLLVGGMVIFGLLYLGLVLVPMSFGFFEVAYDDDAGAWQAITRGFKLASGHRLACSGIGILLYLVAGLGTLACCVGYFFSMPFAALVWTGVYLSLRQGSGLPAPRVRH